ncbi:MAG TPA: TRAP transporter substrate-binding protein [Stellaceae bacterium]|nr:TRAP transporter substrate-binding protein [Stellaceae bacterium]
MTTRRREVLLGATAIATAGSLPAPAIGQGIKELKMVTDWPKNSPGLQTSAERLARSITAISDGRLKVTVYPGGTLVKFFETFDAVSAGAADMYHSGDNYFGSKSPALNFFSDVPFGMTADELSSWIAFGGGQALWDDLDAQFNIKPLMALNTGVQMGGWFNKQVNAPEDFKGLRYRMPGLGADVLRRMGATVVTTPGDEVVSALKSGAVDASEWVGPWMDIAMGFDKAADYYYCPGFHEPGTNITLGINKTLWDELTPSERALIEAAAAAELTRSLAEFNAENVKALKVLRADKRIKILRFNDELIKTFGKLSKEVVADTAAKDPLTRKVYDSYMAFLAGVMDWGELSETGYRDTRRLALA